MNMVFIGTDHRTTDVATLAIRLLWPGATPLAATSVTEGLNLVEHVSPALVVLVPDSLEMSLSEALQRLCRLTRAPLLVLGHQADQAPQLTDP